MCLCTPSRSTYFGLQWNGFYFTCTSIPFGWKASAYMDLMALSSYACFFSPFPNPGSSGTNVFAQMLEPFVFPPFIRMGPLLNFMSLQPCSFTIIVPDLCPKHHWWPILLHRASSHLKLGSKGQKDILLFPDLTFSGSFTSRSLQWSFGRSESYQTINSSFFSYHFSPFFQFLTFGVLLSTVMNASIPMITISLFVSVVATNTSFNLSRVSRKKFPWTLLPSITALIPFIFSRLLNLMRNRTVHSRKS